MRMLSVSDFTNEMCRGTGLFRFVSYTIQHRTIYFKVWYLLLSFKSVVVVHFFFYFLIVNTNDQD